MLLLRDVWNLYRMEMRGALRDKTIVINSLLIPLLIYPFILWLAFVGLTFALGQSERIVARVAVVSWPEHHPELRRDIEEIQRIRLASVAQAEDGIEGVASGELDAFIEFLPPEGAAGGLRDNFSVSVLYDESKERSETARDRIVGAIRKYRDSWIAREAAKLGLDDGAWRIFAIAERNVASKKQMGAFILGLLLPLLFTIMVVVGCFYPAIDVTAGERERGTWETLMVSPASRGAIVLAKYLSVTTFGLCAGLLNFTSMTVTIKPILEPIMRRAGGSFDVVIGLKAMSVAVIGALLLAAFAGAGMMLFASFAKTFKDGQSMIMPFYLVMIVPILALQSPGIQLDARTALIPVANVLLSVRGAIVGTIDWSVFLLAIGASLSYVALIIGLSIYVLKFEDVVVGSYPGTLVTFLKNRLLRAKARAHE